MKTQLYRLTKLAACNAPLVKSADSIEKYRKDFEYSPPVDYYIEGVLDGNEPTIGKRIRMVRDNRNGVKCMGVMTTTPIVEMSLHQDGVSQILQTQNSVYILEAL